VTKSSNPATNRTAIRLRGKNLPLFSINQTEMRSQILYVELKRGSDHNGPAWIGKGFFSKGGQTLYFNGVVLKKASGLYGNYLDLALGSRYEYWLSRVKKYRKDRHSSGSGIIQIDESIVPEYLEQIGQAILLKKKFKIVILNNTHPIKEFTESENRKLK
jgi:hypothetical protein